VLALKRLRDTPSGNLLLSVQIFPELGPALLYQAVSRSLFKIAFFFVDNGIDVTDCPAHTFDTERVASPLLLLIEAAKVQISSYAKQ